MRRAWSEVSHWQQEDHIKEEPNPFAIAAEIVEANPFETNKLFLVGQNMRICDETTMRTTSRFGGFDLNGTS